MRVKVTYPGFTTHHLSALSPKGQGFSNKTIPPRVMYGWNHGPLKNDTHLKNPKFIVEDDDGYVHIVAQSIVSKLPEGER